MKSLVVDPARPGPGDDLGGDRAAAIRVLTGGSPRLVVLLADFAGGNDRALTLLAPNYAKVEFVTRYLDAATNDLARLAAAGHAGPSLAMLRDSAAAPLLEPLVAALADLAGEPIEVPREVAEVAEHVRNRITNLAATGDGWRTDPKSLSIDAPEPG